MTRAVPDASHWRGRRVLVTGHTGFVGGWLCAWLAHCGARVHGFALPPPTDPSFFERTRLASRLEASETGNVNDAAALAHAVDAARADTIFHLAAQPIVREAYRCPAATFATNVMGTVNLLEACRASGGVRHLVVYTTDKVYRNDESRRAFVETDRLGGNEPYSASKAAADWAVGAYWESYYRGKPDAPNIATIRAGNIIGGGDWARERLIPDGVRAFVEGRALVVRNAASVRPWQHVLDVVRATLLLGQAEHPAEVAAEDIAWNLGPPASGLQPVSRVAELAVAAWGSGASWRHEPDGAIPEARVLTLSSDKAERRLGWRCAWSLERTIGAAIEWYRAAYDGRADLLQMAERQIDEHLGELAA